VRALGLASKLLRVQELLILQMGRCCLLCVFLRAAWGCVCMHVAGHPHLSMCDVKGSQLSSPQARLCFGLHTEDGVPRRGVLSVGYLPSVPGLTSYSGSVSRGWDRSAFCS